MPTYEYRCDACGHEFEQYQSITAAPVRKCPSCSKRKVKRLMGIGSALIFKGSGFYATDYRSASYKEGAKKDTPAPAPAACEGCKKDPKTCPASKTK
jgi:putative FmdB family regulatory protein